MADDKPKLFHPGVGQRGMTELHYAAYCADPELLEKGLSAGLDPNARDDYRGYTPVHWLADMAATGGPRVEMLRILIKRGADVSLRANGGETALELAKEAGNQIGDDLAAELQRGAPRDGPDV